jgi:hypothetical protein
MKCGCRPLFRLRVPNLMFPGLKPSRRELTPVRLCSVRLSWRQRARPSTTLHEIQICRSRLEYLVCTTACGGPQPEARVDAEVVSTGCGGMGVLDTSMEVKGLVPERTLMKRYLKFAASFWMGAFLVAGSMAIAQTTPSAKTKKKSGSSTTSTAPVPSTGSSEPTQNATTAASTTTSASGTTQTTAVAHDQQGGTTTPAMKAITGPDKHTIWVPQL